MMFNLLKRHFLFFLTLTTLALHSAPTTPAPQAFMTTLYRSPVTATYAEMFFVNQTPEKSNLYASSSVKPQKTIVIPHADYQELVRLSRQKNTSARRNKLEYLPSCKELLAALETAPLNASTAIRVQLPENQEIIIDVLKYSEKITHNYYNRYGGLSHSSVTYVPATRFTLYQDTKTLPRPIIELVKTLAEPTSRTLGQKIIRGVMYTGGIIGCLVVAAIIADTRY